MAGYQRQQGSLAAQTAKLKLWPFDILALYEANAKGAGGSGVNLRVRGGAGGFGGPTETFAGFGESRNTGAPYQDFEQVSGGAAALGRGLSDGGYSAARMPRGRGTDGAGEPDIYDYRLANARNREWEAEHRSDREANARIINDWGAAQADTAEYWRRWNGDTGTVQQYPGSAAGPVVSGGGYQPSAAPTSETGDYSGGREGGPNGFSRAWDTVTGAPAAAWGATEFPEAVDRLAR